MVMVEVVVVAVGREIAWASSGRKMQVVVVVVAAAVGG